MSSDNILIDPWNDKNTLLTKDDVYDIFERGGFLDAKKIVKINNLDFYQTAFIHPSYVKKFIFEQDEDNEKK